MTGARVGLALLVVGWGVLTWHRAGLWTDESRLWQGATVEAPAKPRPWINLGNALPDRTAAQAAYRQAWTVAQARAQADERQLGMSLALTNHGFHALSFGDLERAHRCLSEAHTLNPRNPEIRDAWRSINQAATAAGTLLGRSASCW